MSQSPSKVLRYQLVIGMFLKSEEQSQRVLNALGRDRYTVTVLSSREQFSKFIEQEKQHLDCLILEDNSELPQLANWLHGQATLLPIVLIQEAVGPHSGVSPTELSPHSMESAFSYHTAEVRIPATEIVHLAGYIERAITQFLNLSPTCRVSASSSTVDVTHDLTTQNFLMLQQRRLTEKLKERLGYLGVYYKRNPQNFFRYLSPPQKQELLDALRTDYRNIVLRYFTDDGTLNQRIDDFVNTAFFADISVSQLVEIHMELMDEFSKQLKLEGRSEEVLLDYRLTLIDAIAHLCEMYRRSIPRES